MNGFQLADTFMGMKSTVNGLLLYVLFLSALGGVVIGVLIALKKSVPVVVDWIIIIACIGCGLAVYFGALSDNTIKLQSGAYMILIGWIAIFAMQIISLIKKEL
jgi:hypothetical protein